MLSRRRFLQIAGAGAAVGATTGLDGLAPAVAADITSARRLPSPNASGIEHIVVLCMENRSFDHYLGWVPGAYGRQAGLSYRDGEGVVHQTHRLDTWTGCGFSDPGHGYASGRVQYAGGKANGFMKPGSGNDTFALGYYEADQLEMTAAVARNFTVCDRYFASIMSSTYPNRFYTHAAATDRIKNTFDISSLRTVWDQLADAGVSANYYFSDLPFLGLWGQKYLPTCRRAEQFLVDATAGTLPQYSYVEPFFLGAGQGGSNDDHPAADIRRGQAFMGRVINTIVNGPLWSKTVLVITYDEWGGFFDHLKPVRFADAFQATPTEEHNLSGFRVPAQIISPFARKGGVAHTVFDHSSVLKLVQWRFGLPSLTPRDAAANNLAMALDFSAPNAAAPDLPEPTDPGPYLCDEESPAKLGELHPTSPTEPPRATGRQAMAPSLPTDDAPEDDQWEGLAALPVMRHYLERGLTTVEG